MTQTREILALLGACLPLFSAIIWMAMITLSVHDSRTRLERRIKRTVLWLYIFMVINWLSLILYTNTPPLSPWINVAALLAYTLSPVQFYRYVCELSETAELRPFSMWHYALPVAIASVLGIWSLFVPWDVQVGLVESRGVVSPGYTIYSRLFLSKPVLRMIWVFVYTIFSLARLWRYYREIGRRGNKYPRPVRWITGLVGFVVVIMLITVSTMALSREEVITSALLLALGFLRTGEDFIIGYNVIRRNFLLYIPSVKERMDRMETAPRRGTRTAGSPTPPDAAAPVRIALPGVKLTKKRFEEYITQRRLWLDPNVKLTDLVEPLGKSRTTLSNFINKTYGMNFNQYINSLRLTELGRLMALPSNAGKSAADLFYKAGFASKRNYTRAKEARK